MRSRQPPVGRAASTAALLIVALLAIAPTTIALASVPATASASPATAPSSVVVNITATTDLSFAPDSFTVSPGESVLLVVTQGADFPHTFTLSSVANLTLPSSDTPSEVAAFFNAHPPLVNLSLGSTAGTKESAMFTAPTATGTYEFLCLIHFPTMVGVMTDSAGAPSASGSSGLTTLEVVAIGAVVAAVLIVAVLVLVRRRGKRPT